MAELAALGAMRALASKALSADSVRDLVRRGRVVGVELMVSNCSGPCHLRSLNDGLCAFATCHSHTGGGLGRFECGRAGPSAREGGVRPRVSKPAS